MDDGGSCSYGAFTVITNNTNDTFNTWIICVESLTLNHFSVLYGIQKVRLAYVFLPVRRNLALLCLLSDLGCHDGNSSLIK